MVNRRGMCILAQAALLVFALGACGKTSGATTPAAANGSNSTNSSNSSSAAVPLSHVKNGALTIGFSNYAGVIPFYRSMIAGVKNEAATYGWKVDVTDSNFDPNKQVEDIQSMIAEKVNVILVSPGDENALIPAYQAAARAGIPVVSIANHLSAAGRTYETAFYGQSNEQIGVLMTDQLVKLMHGQGSVLQVKGPLGVAFVTEESAGAAKVFAAHPGVKVVFSEGTNQLTADEGYRVAQAGLAGHPHIAGAWAQDDEIAVGLIRALQQRGLAGRIPVAWDGGTPEAMDLAAKGQLVGVILPSYQWGVGAVEKIHAAIATGAPFGGTVDAPMFVLKSPSEARQLIAECPKIPDEVWCLGRR